MVRSGGGYEEGASIITVGFPDDLSKKGIVRRLSGAGPSASSFLRARSVCASISIMRIDPFTRLTIPDEAIPLSRPSRRVQALHSSLLDM